MAFTGEKKVTAGIIAKGRLTDGPSIQKDFGPSIRFWTDRSKANIEQLRVQLNIDEIANKRKILKRSWMVEDPILNDLSILKMVNQTNYIIAEEHEKRIDALWENTGVDWTRAQSIAALRAYNETYGSSVSLLPGSPIAKTSNLIGRAVKGVYNKVLNFRHIDPRDERAGFSGGGAVDREVWDEFYNPQTKEIDKDALEEQFNLLWHYSNGSLADVQKNDTIEINETVRVSQSRAYQPGPVPGAKDYIVSTNHHENWFVYILVLSNKKAIKIGMSHDPGSRLKAYNHTIMPELTDLYWKLDFVHKVGNADIAREVEQRVLQNYSVNQLPSNGEILRDVDVSEARLAIINAAQSLY